jgi:hypothetical protein
MKAEPATGGRNGRSCILLAYVTMGQVGLVGRAASFDGTGNVHLGLDNLGGDWTFEALHGDFNGDHEFTSADLVLALQQGRWQTRVART